jgi:hypothetical protein
LYDASALRKSNTDADQSVPLGDGPHAGAHLDDP